MRGWSCSRPSPGARSRATSSKEPSMAEIGIDRVTKRFGDVEALKDVSLAIPDGELVVLLGPTGAGKTTLLRLVAGLETPDAGSIFIDGRDATTDAPAQRDVSFVFQQYSLY